MNMKTDENLSFLSKCNFTFTPSECIEYCNIRENYWENIIGRILLGEISWSLTKQPNEKMECCGTGKTMNEWRNVHENESILEHFCACLYIPQKPSVQTETLHATISYILALVHAYILAQLVELHIQIVQETFVF